MSTPPDWNLYLKVFMILAIAGLVLVLASGFWHVLLLLIIAAVLFWLWQSRQGLVRK